MASKLMSAREGVSVWPLALADPPELVLQLRTIPELAEGCALKRPYSAVWTSSQFVVVTPFAAPNSLKTWHHPGIW